MKAPALQETILGYLRGAARPVSSRDLAQRFLLISNAGESTCHRLLAPLLEPVEGVAHHPERGWSFTPPRHRSPVPPPPVADRPDGTAATPASGTLVDFMALASEGSGPGGSGSVRAVSLLPVVAGEECQEEHLPAWAAGADDAAEPETAGPPPDAPRRAPRRTAQLAEADLDALVEAVGDLPVVCHRAARDLEPLRRAAALGGRSFHPQVVSLAKLGHLLLGLKANHALVDLATTLGVEARGPDDCRGRVRLVARCFLDLVPRLAATGVDSWGALAEFQNMPADPIDLSGFAFTARDLKALPESPGVYTFRDRHGAVVYIGKARNLRARLGSYFIPSARGTARGRAILETVHSLEVEPAASELEAILVEAALLAEHRPRLNRQFDVHERPAPYGPRLNLVVILPERRPGDAEATRCTMHLLRGGRYIRRLGGLPAPGPDRRPGGGDDPWASVVRTIAGTYFAAPAADAEKHSNAVGGEVDWRLVSSYVRKHRDTVNVLDVDECSSPEEARDRLGVLVAAALDGGRRVLAR